MVGRNPPLLPPFTPFSLCLSLLVANTYNCKQQLRRHKLKRDVKHTACNVWRKYQLSLLVDSWTELRIHKISLVKVQGHLWFSLNSAWSPAPPVRMTRCPWATHSVNPTCSWCLLYALVLHGSPSPLVSVCVMWVGAWEASVIVENNKSSIWDVSPHLNKKRALSHSYFAFCCKIWQLVWCVLWHGSAAEQTVNTVSARCCFFFFFFISVNLLSFGYYPHRPSCPLSDWETVPTSTAEWQWKDSYNTCFWTVVVVVGTVRWNSEAGPARCLLNHLNHTKPWPLQVQHSSTSTAFLSKG